MFYEPSKRNHGLPHEPFLAIVTPRPIGWISAVNAKGDVNLSPYSFFNAVSGKPPTIMFSSESGEKQKDAAAYIAETGEFVCNLATWDLREHMNLTSPPYPTGVNEMEKAGLTAAPSRMVKAPRVAASPCALECKLLKFVEIESLDGKRIPTTLVFGQVVGVYIDDNFIKDGRLDTAAMKPIGRCGYNNEYSVVDSVFLMDRPPYPKAENPY
jgi:flavin reductase (DIM6/NTAB) family NADH-FMN oxidoreductase RutF